MTMSMVARETLSAATTMNTTIGSTGETGIVSSGIGTVTSGIGSQRAVETTGTDIRQEELEETHLDRGIHWRTT